MILAFAGWQAVVCAMLRSSGASGWAWRRGRTAPSSVARLALIANNTRLLVLSEPGVLPNVASFFLAGMARRLADDWLNVHGHRVVLAETFCDPERFIGTLYRAAGWEKLGKTRGFARANRRDIDPHNNKKEIFAVLLRRDARALLGSPCQRTSCRPPIPPWRPGTRRRCAALAAVDDLCRAQGRKHTLACVLTVHILAAMANLKGCLAAEQCASSLTLGGTGGHRCLAEPEDGAL